MPDVELPIPFEAYTGEEPFIFISYAHKDGAKVFTLIEEMHERGYRIWYDEGIDPGNEWPEEIAKALYACSLFVVFITENSAASINVRNEVNFALNRGKSFLAIYLEEVELPLGMQLRMGDIQAILSWKMSGELFWEKLEEVLPETLQEKSKEKDVQIGSIREYQSTEDNTLETADKEQKIVKQKKLPWWGWAGAAAGFVLLAILLSGLLNGGKTGGLSFLSSTAPTITETPLPTKTIVPSATSSPMITPTATVTPGIGSTLLSEKDGMTMVYVPEGEFKMGTDTYTYGELNEKPAHMVFLDAYWIDKTEVTEAMYQLCVEDGICEYSEDHIYDETSADFPVQVNWYDARDYCTWAGKELPTEAQWEKAARGTDGRKYPWGDEDPDCEHAQFIDCYRKTYVSLLKVGSLEAGASPYGALDMCGNVSEWVSDWYDDNYYSVSPYENPENINGADVKGSRGGGYNGMLGFMHVSFRSGINPAGRHVNGIRCVLEVE